MLNSVFIIEKYKYTITAIHSSWGFFCIKIHQKLQDAMLTLRIKVVPCL